MEADDPIALRIVEAMTQAWTCQSAAELNGATQSLLADLENLYMRRAAEVVGEEHPVAYVRLVERANIARGVVTNGRSENVVPG